MPSYELSVIFKGLMKQPALHDAIKRCATTIGEGGGLVRSMEHLGEKYLPYKMVKDRRKYQVGNYVVINFDASVENVFAITEEVKTEKDLLRGGFVRKEEEVGRPCDAMECDYGELTELNKRRLQKNVDTYIKKL